MKGASLKASNIQMPVTNMPSLPLRKSSESETPESCASVGMMPEFRMPVISSKVATQAGELMVDSVMSALKNSHSPF